MISSKNLAEAIYKISLESKKDNKVIVEAILIYIQKYKLESLLPKTLVYLEDKLKKDLNWNTFFLESRFSLKNELIDDIKNKLKVNKTANVLLNKNENLIGGFRATYQGIIYDASIKNQLQLLKNYLIK